MNNETEEQMKSRHKKELIKIMSVTVIWLVSQIIGWSLFKHGCTGIAALVYCTSFMLVTCTLIGMGVFDVFLGD